MGELVNFEPRDLPAPVAAVAHGKINLHLGVGDARADGYHELHTVFQSVDLQEKVTLLPIREASDGGVVELTVAGPGRHAVPTDHSNLAWRAVEAVRQRAASEGVPESVTGMALRIHIDKGVPVAGGMAGGSADAAAALVAANELYYGHHSAADVHTPLTREQLMEIGAELGADVPFCILGGTALGTGKGEELVSVMTRGTYHWALAMDKRGLSTPKVFAQLDAQRATASQRAAEELSAAEGGAAEERPTGARAVASRAGTTDALMSALLTGDPERLAPHLVNDLQAPAISLLPSLRETLSTSREAGALAAIVSGSGPTIAMLCADAESAVDVAAAVSVAGKASATATTSSPAEGARLVEAQPLA